MDPGGPAFLYDHFAEFQGRSGLLVHHFDFGLFLEQAGQAQADGCRCNHDPYRFHCECPFYTAQIKKSLRIAHFSKH